MIARIFKVLWKPWDFARVARGIIGLEHSGELPPGIGTREDAILHCLLRRRRRAGQRLVLHLDQGAVVRAHAEVVRSEPVLAAAEAAHRRVARRGRVEAAGDARVGGAPLDLGQVAGLSWKCKSNTRE